MAIPYSNTAIKKPFSLLFVIFTTFFLLLARNAESAKAISFNFTKFSAGQSSITLQGNAEILSNGILALTSRANASWNTGRALYTTPVPIWDNTTGNVASFVTSFSFIVQDYEGFKPADGIVFFLAPPDTVIPSNSTGGFLGIIDGNNAFNQFVGVEFDSHTNEWDPDSAHIGIDVNSLISLKTVEWKTVSGFLVKVSIIYDSLSKTLSVAVTNKNGRISTVSQVIDLKAVLPQKVRVGLSATTADGRQTHDIHSWSFTSTLETTTTSTSEKLINIASSA
ncbi:Legume lectin, alpha chain, conserved site [Sesbania bispinosa]|nr:Legume lectin, alpha chain, conserved site [Sesbania bispinosa]KAJ1403294.1 Legume lectin, alpha chain, conserved site [Sesbania bispinosa]